MLLAWLLTGLFVSLLLWRVRFLVRGDTVMGRGEATAFGVLVATIMGGTVWMLLAATPFVFNEDIAWSICLTVGSIFALLGVIERPSWGRVIASGVLILCANLDRSTTGWACVVGAGLIAVWFLLGLGGAEDRRWFFPVLGAGLVPLAIGCAVNYSKFGVLFGVSNVDQVWTHVNAYRRKFLAANHGAEEGTIFVPTNVLTYFSARRAELHIRVPLRHHARQSTAGSGWGALRPALSDGQPYCIDAALVRPEHLGSGDRLSASVDREGGQDPSVVACRRRRRRRPHAVGLYRTEVPGGFRTLFGTGRPRWPSPTSSAGSKGGRCRCGSGP